MTRPTPPSPPPPPTTPTIPVVLAVDPATGTWTAGSDALGAAGTGPTPGAAVDDLLAGLSGRIAAIDALTAAGGLTASWKERRQAMITARRMIPAIDEGGGD